MATADGLILSTFPSWQTGVSFSTFALNEINLDYYAVMFRAPKAQAIARCFVNVAAISGSPSLEVSLQGVTAGVPDGTIKGGGTAKKQYSPTASATWQTLDAPYTPIRGELLCVVVKLVSGTSCTLNVRIGGTSPLQWFGVTFDNSGAPQKVNLTTPAIWGIKGSGATWCFGNPISSSATTSITTASIIESGMVFTSPNWATLQLVGVRAYYRLNASSTAEIRVYNGLGATDTTVAQSITVDSTELQSTGTSGFAIFHFPSVNVSPSAGFRITSRTTAGTAVEFGNTVVDPEDLQVYGPWNGTAYRTRRTTGNWTDSAVNGVFLEPIFDDVTANGGTTIVSPPRKQIWTPRAIRRPAAWPVIVQQSSPSMQWLPISRTLVRAARAVRTRAPAAVVPIPGGTVTTNVYVPIAQSRRLAIQQRTVRRSVAPAILQTLVSGPTVYLPLVQQRVRTRERWTTRKILCPVTLTTTTPGPTTLVPIRQTAAKHLRPAHVVRRIPVSAVIAQQAVTQTILISAPRIVR